MNHLETLTGADASNQKGRASARTDSTDTVGIEAQKHEQWPTGSTGISKPTISVANGDLDTVVAEAEKALAANGHFQCGNAIVTVRHDPIAGAEIVHLNPHSLQLALARSACWEKLNSRSRQYDLTNPPMGYVKALLHAVEYPILPRLCGIVRQPTVLHNGSFVQKPGFNASTGLYAAFDEAMFPIPTQEEMSFENAQRALELLEELFDEFPLTTEADRSAALAGILTAVVRPGLEAAPFFHVNATAAGSGKTLMSLIFSAFAQQGKPKIVPLPSTEEECKKLLLAEFRNSPPALLFDNLESFPAFPSLCLVLTSETYGGRVLGESKTISVPTRTLLLSNGNNVAPVGDMIRRTVVINLSPNCALPAERQFRNSELLENIAAQRGAYVAAALTVVGSYLAQDITTQCRPIASFNQWSKMVREPLIWLGRPDPAKSIFNGMSSDPSREALGYIVDLWFSKFGTAPVIVRKLSDTVYLDENWRDAVSQIPKFGNGSSFEDNRVLGQWIAKNEGKIVNGKRIRRYEGTVRNVAQWQIEVL